MSDDGDDHGGDHDGNYDEKDNSSKVMTMADNSRMIYQAILYFPKSVFNQFSKIK